MRDRFRSVVPYLILVVGFGAFLAYAFPGYLSTDSISQLEQARSHQYSDWHPPAMAALWTVIELVVRGAAGMLLLQSSLFLFGVYRLLRRGLTGPWAAVMAVAILLFPPVLAPMAVIWKDSQMAGFLVMGVSLVIAPHRVWSWVGVILMVIGTAMRDNALAATLPVFVFAACFVPRFEGAAWKRVAVAIAVWVATVGAATTMNRALTRVEQHPWHCSVAMGDLVGILRTSRKYTDQKLLQVFDGMPVVVHEGIWGAARTIYTPVTWWYVTNGDHRIFDWPATPEHRAAVTRAWRTLVLHNPLSYVIHRWRVFKEVLGLSGQPPFDPVWNIEMNMTQQGEPATDGIKGAVGDGLKWTAANTFLFRPSFYFLLSLLLLPLARRHRDILALLASGVCYELTLLIAAPSPDFRYSHWMIVCTLVATVLLIRRRMSPPPDAFAAIQAPG